MDYEELVKCASEYEAAPGVGGGDVRLGICPGDADVFVGGADAGGSVVPSGDGGVHRGVHGGDSGGGEVSFGDFFYGKMNVEELLMNFGSVLALLLVLVPALWAFAGRMQKIADNIRTLFIKQDKLEAELKEIDSRTNQTDQNIAAIFAALESIKELLRELRKR